MAHRFAHLYGYWEVRARVEAGVGYGPSILLWPESGNWPTDGELDLMEIPGGARTQAFTTIHYGAGNTKIGTNAIGDFTQWHTYAVDWQPGYVAFYIDNVEVLRTTDPSAIPSKPMWLGIQLDVGAAGHWIPAPDATTPPTVALHVDYVRLSAIKP